MTDYSTIDLTVSKEDARDAIQEAVKGLSVSESAEEIKFRSNSGQQVAVLTSGDEDGTATLRYRSSPSLSVRGDETRRARKVREAVAEYAE